MKGDHLFRIKLLRDAFPPSKNRIYISSKAKRSWAKALSSKIVDAHKKIRAHQWFSVEITFVISDPSRFKALEPHNYIDAIADTLFGPRNDNRIVDIRARKMYNPNEDDTLIIDVYKEEPWLG